MMYIKVDAIVIAQAIHELQMIELHSFPGLMALLQSLEATNDLTLQNALTMQAEDNLAVAGVNQNGCV